MSGICRQENSQKAVGIQDGNLPERMQNKQIRIPCNDGIGLAADSQFNQHVIFRVTADRDGFDHIHQGGGLHERDQESISGSYRNETQARARGESARWSGFLRQAGISVARGVQKIAESPRTIRSRHLRAWTSDSCDISPLISAAEGGAAGAL